MHKTLASCSDVLYLDCIRAFCAICGSNGSKVWGSIHLTTECTEYTESDPSDLNPFFNHRLHRWKPDIMHKTLASCSDVLYLDCIRAFCAICGKTGSSGSIAESSPSVHSVVKIAILKPVTTKRAPPAEFWPRISDFWPLVPYPVRICAICGSNGSKVRGTIHLTTECTEYTESDLSSPNPLLTTDYTDQYRI